MADGAPATTEEPPAKKRKGDKGLPKGIFGDLPKLQARLPGFKVEGKACQKPIPGTYKDVDAAVAAQADAQQKLAAGGPEAVWPNWNAPAERNKRNEVRRSAAQALCLCSLRCQCCAQGSRREQERAAKRADASAKKWNHGAPLSKKSKGLGVQQGANGRFVAVGEKPRDPALPTSVPMPSAVEDIMDPGMRTMWEEQTVDGSGSAGPEPID